MTTQQANPYQSPQSEIRSPASEDYGDVKVISFSGRIGRLRYIAYSMGLMLLVGLVGGVVSAILGPYAIDPVSGELSVVMGLALLVGYAVMIVASIVLAVRRINDFDTSGWLVLLFLVPIVNAIFSLALWLIPGSKGENRYGLQPPPNSGGVIFLSLLLPIVMAIGIVAAIAIPAYQDYAQKATAMQIQQ